MAYIARKSRDGTDKNKHEFKSITEKNLMCSVWGLLIIQAFVYSLIMHTDIHTYNTTPDTDTLLSSEDSKPPASIQVVS